jgi:hypothetical protein
MPDQERGAYSPQTDAPLAFDARRSSGGGFPTTLVISLVILAVLIVAIVMFYRSGIRSAGQGPATIGAPVTQMKSPAPPGAQPSDEAAGLQIYKSEAAPPPSAASAPLPAPVFSAPPEQPQARPTAPVVTQALPPAASAPAAPAAVAATGATTPVRPAPAKPAPKDEIGDLLDKGAAASVKPAAHKPVAVAVASAPAAKPAAKPTPVAAAAAGGVSAQIGAYSSDALAQKGWSDTAAAFPADMTGKGRHFEPVAKDGKTLYRAAVTGFASKDVAQAFCAKLKAAGRPCIVK